MYATKSTPILAIDFPGGSILFINEFRVPGEGWIKSKVSAESDYHAVIDKLDRMRATKVCLTIQTRDGFLVHPDYNVKDLVVATF